MRGMVILFHCSIVIWFLPASAGRSRYGGWNELADAYGFALLYPQQKRANNLNKCFNWLFVPEDISKGSGEARSIRQMMSYVFKELSLDNAGATVLLRYDLDILGHAIAVDPGEGGAQGGAEGKFAKDVDFFSTYWAVIFFGLLE